MRRWLEDRSGATSIEYAMIGALISIACITGVRALGSGTNSLFGRVGTAFDQYLPW